MEVSGQLQFRGDHPQYLPDRRLGRTPCRSRRFGENISWYQW